MRWDELFADLESRWDALAEDERRAQVAERTRAELARVEMLDRLRGAEGTPVRLHTVGGDEVAGELVRVGADFVLVESTRQESIVPVGALVAVRGLGRTSVPAQAVGAVRARLGLRSVLRRIASDRSVVTLVRADGHAVVGTLQRVGANFLEMVEHPADEPPRGASGRSLVAVPFTAVALVRRDLVDVAY